MTELCKAMKYKNKTKETMSCDKSSAYGVLCGAHARQISGTPLGFSFNRVRRIHLPGLTDEVLQESITEYTESHGRIVPQLSDPMKYLPDVISFIKKHERAASGEIIDHITNIARLDDMSASKVGSIMRVLVARKIVKRTQCSVNVKGRRQGSSFYELV